MFASLETLNVIMALKEGRNRLIIVGAFIAPVLGVINSSTEGREWWNWSLSGNIQNSLIYPEYIKTFRRT